MSGYTPRVKAALTAAGCRFVRQGRGDHEVWESPINGTLKDAGLPKQF